MKLYYDAELDHIRQNRLGELCGAIGQPTPEDEQLIEAEILRYKEANNIMVRSDWFKKMRMEVA